MSYGLLVLSELDKRITAHKQLYTEEGPNPMRNAVIVALVDLKEWLENTIDQDLTKMEAIQEKKAECDCHTCLDKVYNVGDGQPHA